MKVWMLPEPKYFRSEESGIKRVVEAYHKYCPEFGIEFVSEDEGYELKVVHAGTGLGGADVAMTHGLYWTADYAASKWEWKANANVIESMRQAKVITCPSEWVAESIRRDMRREPVVVGHGIDWDEWQHDMPNGGFVLWNKNRAFDVCSPQPLEALTVAYPEVHFVSTFAPKRKRNNLSEIGVIPHDQMKQLVQSSAVYLSTTKETFGIGVLEAMAAGIPVLGYAHGGNLELVQHGVSGYLAEPGDVEVLIEGLGYCLKYRDILGDNGRALARTFTWERECEKVAGVFRRAAEPEPATCAIIIPSYLYADQVGRAIDSAVRQTYREVKDIVVVDDGSPDQGATEAVVREWTERDNRVRYVRQENQGVAVARNTGIASTGTKYVCCLDADDAMEPPFIEKCVRALERDPALGIAYTALRYILPDGKTGVSPWPAEWDFDKQLRRQNQVPTCCVYRKEMWAALGGYKKRYCPIGAGSEDAEFWTRSGAYGWKAGLATAEPLFIYSWQSGRVSGNREYNEPDWLGWHPWSHDGQHPFASYATPARFSHPVRQYDEPTVSVVIPVGPGHEDRLEDALDSLEAQTLRKWEAVVVCDGATLPERLRSAYPYLRLHYTTKGNIPAGAGAARNLGARMARAPFLVFLDADDYMDPGCLDAMLEEWHQEAAIIYTDYIGLAFIDDEMALDPKLRERIISRDEKDGFTAMRYKALDYDVEKAQAQPTGDPTKIYTWNLITSLVPKAWHEEVGGFDEDLASWEDVDYFWRLAKAGKCFRRIPEPLVFYHFYTGGRRDLGHSRHQELFTYLCEKHERIEVMGCSGCGKPRTAPAETPQQRDAPQLALNDSDFKLCVYTSPNRGQTHVYGTPLFRNRLDGVHMIQDRQTKLWRIHYGWRAGGDKFLVHVQDIKHAPHLYREVETGPKPPPVAREAAQPPVPIVAEDEAEEEERQPPEPKRIDVEAVMAGKAQPADRRTGPPQKLADKGNGFDPQTIPGVTHKIAQEMTKRHIMSLDDILDLGEEGLMEINGVGAVRARTIYGAAMEAVTGA